MAALKGYGDLRRINNYLERSDPNRTMLRTLEILILELVAWFYSQGQVMGLLTLGVAAIACILAQFFITGNTTLGKTFLPGTLGLCFFVAEVFHFSSPDKVQAGAVHLIDTLKSESAVSLKPIPFTPLEELVSLLVAPAQSRFVFEESLFIVLFGYLLLVGRVSWQEYKKTGLLFGDMSFSSLVKDSARRPKRSMTNELGSGDLANTEQIANWTKPTGKPGDTCLYVKELRGAEGISFNQAKLILPREERNRHVLVVAKTGGGKTTKFIKPILYNDCMDPDRSVIVIDSKPEMWKSLAAMTRKYNPKKNILLFNPLDRERSLSWNILAKVEDDTDCKLIAQTVISATDQPQAKSDSPFFRNNALAVLNSVMVGLLHDPKEVLSMPRIHQLVQSGMKGLCDWIEAHPEAIRNSRAFVDLARSGSQNADTIMSELSMRLSAWDLTAIRATTNDNELDIEDLIQKPTLFIVELRESELEMLRPMANVIVVELLRFMTKRAEQCPKNELPRPVGLVIDEFASALGRLPDIHVKLNTLRSRNVSIVAAIQSTAQIKANYNDDADSVLAGFSTKIFMPPLDLADSEWASKESGQMTIRFQTQSVGANRKMIEVFASRNDSTQEQVQQRAVLTPDEIGRPADNICTYFMPSTPVFQGHLIPFYKLPELLKPLTEFEKGDYELKLRTAAIEYSEKPIELPQGQGGGAAPAAGGTGLPPGITNTKGWTDEQIAQKLEEVKKSLDWDNTTGSARKWWEAFESENKTRTALVLRLAEELQTRKATITEFFLAYVYSNTDNIQANLSYLDYTRLKKEEEKKKKEAAGKAIAGGGGDESGGQNW
jgi:type IV secretory pathway TraG/TraD family ATPase VirD4